jgi:DNA-binding LytR/AlgR family response regulator
VVSDRVSRQLQTNIRESQGKLREMTDNAVHVSPVAGSDAPVAAPVLHTETSFGARHKRGFIVAIVIGLLMAVLAPLQTDLIPFWSRLFYWEILMVSGAIIGLGVTEAVQRWGKLKHWIWIEIVVTGVLIALPLTMIVIGTSHIFFGVTAPGVIRFSYNFGITAVISIAVTALNYMINGSHIQAEVKQTSVTSQPVPATTETPNRFVERLPLPMRGIGIAALQAEDHYLRVHFDDGQSTLILMRLSDALSELPSDQGAQTHRSWWVAKDAVRNVSKADGRATLKLDHGIEAPVSRSFYKALGDAGWLN